MGGLIPMSGGPVHALIAIVFDVLILAMIVFMLVSWFIMLMPQAGGTRFFRFMETMIAPLTDPIRKRIPSASVGMLNLSYTVAFIFAWWALRILAAIIIQGLPFGW